MHRRHRLLNHILCYILCLHYFLDRVYLIQHFHNIHLNRLHHHQSLQKNHFLLLDRKENFLFHHNNLQRLHQKLLCLKMEKMQ